ncbi:AtpZ/AtpI family protein [Aequorivita viscosa]|uniref:ATP synthase protein I n=1 Tax=Aequorivita viscosa TaxID=797419 RepID=A0A1M6EPJ4_9FLAO|nr:AtpZ/AtpI family protein [Aequorivita viscosa]SDW03855.1 ATP synthase protein I [Aequorivita viscosa]SHI87278.1 ATP synthase protein I [Aequorivita viscosa]
MSDEKQNTNNSFEKVVGDKEERKLQAQREKKSVWAGLGLFGMIGWSIVVPTILGAALGMWLDKHYKNDFSWTLSLLVAGLMLGCLIAWNWVQKENNEIHKNNKDGNE